VREVEGFLLGSGRGLASGGTHAAFEVATHLLSLIGFDGAGVRLFLGDADRLECVENGVAFLFQLAR
jgi:hypothetical protein